MSSASPGGKGGVDGTTAPPVRRSGARQPLGDIRADVAEDVVTLQPGRGKGIRTPVAVSHHLLSGQAP